MKKKLYQLQFRGCGRLDWCNAELPPCSLDECRKARAEAGEFLSNYEFQIINAKTGWVVDGARVKPQNELSAT